MHTRQVLAPLLVCLFLLTPAQADDAVKDVEKAINALNQAFHKGDALVIKRMLTADHVAVTPYYGGAMTRGEQLKTLADLKLTEYTSSKLKVSMLGKDAALVTYSLTLKGTFKGKPVPHKNHASAIWVRQEGKWLEKFYQETALDE